MRFVPYPVRFLDSRFRGNDDPALLVGKTNLSKRPHPPIVPESPSVRRPRHGANLAEFLFYFVPGCAAVLTGVDVPMQAVGDDDIRIRWMGPEPVDGRVRRFG